MTEEKNILEGVNDEQKKAITFGDGPLLIVAGAGTGKTTVITRRLAWLILSGQAKTDEVLALTFSDKAAGEMEERVDQLLPYGYVDLWISTFHSFGERLLKNHALEIGLPNDFKLLDQTQQWLLVRQNLNKFNLDYYRPLGNPAKFIHALLRHFSRAKDEEVYPEQYLEYAEKLKLDSDSADELKTQEIKRTEEVANAYHVYQQLLLANNFLDFGDLINYTLRLLRQRPHLLEKYRQQFKYILVDEFQDTNWAQYQLIKMLVAPKNNLTAVADDDQSIYKFRGACISNILEFKKDYPNSKEVVLVKNYRSGQEILDLSYKFIRLNNPNRLECMLANIDKKLIACEKPPAVISHLHFDTEAEEAEGIVKKIIELKENDQQLSWNDFAILVRANSQADIFVQALLRHGLPYYFLASRGLFSKPIILDLVCYLNVLNNFHDSPSFYRVLSLPFGQVPAEDVVEILHYCDKKSLTLYQGLVQAVALPLKSGTVKKIDQLLGQIRRHSQLAREKKVTEVIFAFLTDLQFEGVNYLKYLDAKDDQTGRESLEFLNTFFKQARKFEKETADPSIRNFLNFHALALEAGDEGSLNPDLESGPEAVKVMTVHAAKGLEFKHVFVVNLVDRRFPAMDKAEAIELPDRLVKENIPEGDVHLQEERRLFYVAMTRAKQGLWLTSAEDYGGSRKKKLSRFLLEAGLVDSVEAKERKKPTGLVIFSRPQKIKEKMTPTLPAKFSFTQLRVFDICPWQYRYSHVLKIPVAGRYTFSFGKTIHLTLQKFFQRIMEAAGASQTSLFQRAQAANEKAVKHPSLEELFKIYEECWIEDWYEDKKHLKEYQEKGRKILREFYHLNEGKFPIPKYLEKGFNLKIDGYTLKGQIDRVDPLPNEQIEILDYKTGKVPKDEKLAVDQKEQLLIYQLAAQEVLKEKVGRLTYYYLEENKPISFLGEERELIKLKEKIRERIEEIKKAQFEPKPSKFSCQQCDYKSICQYKIL